jgi:hypothetical protein
MQYGAQYAAPSEHAQQTAAAEAFNPAAFDADALRKEILSEKKESSKKKKKPKDGQLRFAGGESWVDDKLDVWPPNDFRIFVGNLGPEVCGSANLSCAVSSRMLCFVRLPCSDSCVQIGTRQCTRPLPLVRAQE